MKPLLFIALLFAAGKATAQTGSTKVADSAFTKSIGAVTVTATKRLIEIYPDKTVLNVDASPSAIGQNALEYLRQAPGVVVDASENIGLAGKPGVAIYLDGRPTQLSGNDLAQLLKSIEASNIKQIEIIANPSAKYDAAGTGGIINIKLKKPLTDGLAGNVSGSWVQSTHGRGNGAANLGWRKGKLALLLNAGGNGGLQHTVANNDRVSGGNSFTQRSLERDYFNGHSLRTGLDYALSQRSTLGFLYNKNYRYTRMENTSTTLIQQAAAPDTVLATSSTAPMPAGRHAFNVNYSFAKEGLTFTADADYTFFQTSLHNRLQNDMQPAGAPKLFFNGIENDVDVDIRIKSARWDMEKALHKGIKIETGAKWMVTETANRLSVRRNESSGIETDTAASNQFLFDEQITAAYASIKGGQKAWSWQAGLRAEHTDVQGRATSLKGAVDNRPDTAYLSFFPTLFVQYSWGQKHQLGLAANRRIERPTYQDQTPYIYALDALNIEQGNPYLMPQFTASVELSYTYKWATSIKLGYARTTDYKEGLTYQVGKNTVQIQQNAGTKDMVSLSIGTPLQPARWWSLYLSATPYYHYYKVLLNGFGTTERQSGGSWAFNGYLGNNFKMGGGWTGDLSGWFNYQNRATIYVSKPIGSINMGVQKAVLKNAGTIKLSVVDIFNTQRWEQTANTANLQLSTYRKWESRNITVGFSWRFGKKDLKGARERQTAGEEDAGRIK